MGRHGGYSPPLFICLFSFTMDLLNIIFQKKIKNQNALENTHPNLCMIFELNHRTKLYYFD